MFTTPRPSSPRQRTASCSTDDTRDKPRRLFHRYYAHELSMSSQSLATANSHHDDLPTPSLPTHASHTTSAHSTPMTSPSTGYSSLFPGSLSSATSESVPSPESKYRSEFGMLIPGSSPAYSAIHGSASSRSSNPVTPWSRSPTESDSQSSAPPIPSKRPYNHLSHLHRPFTAPNSPSTPATPSTVDTTPADHHTRSHSRITVGIKNLFSRHAIPSPSRFSFNSTATTPPDSEASSSSFQVPAVVGKWSMTPRKSRPPDLEISGTVTPAIPSPGCGSNSPIDAHRRFASEAAGKFYNARTSSGLPTSQESIDASSRNAPSARSGLPKSRNVLRRRPSGSAKLFKSRERGMSSPTPRPNESDVRLSPEEGMTRQASVPFPLTPAGAVVEAYKQQELHRDDMSSPPKLSIDDRMSSPPSHDGGYDRDHPEQSPTPYYTVLGSSSERRVQASSPDEPWGKLEASHRVFTRSQATLSHQPSMSDPGGRSLTRKLSSRWRKTKGGGGVVSEELSSREKGHSKGRPSLQEAWGFDKSNRRSTGRSMDGTPNTEDGAWASPSAGHARSASKGDKNEGPKLWQLMRRISTGGLRDRYQSSDKVVPPVPAIPKELLKKASPNERNNEPLSTPRHQPSSPLPDKDHSRPTAPRNIAVTRPSVATSSSSPNSSDVASAQFFQKTHSARSSMSSFGEPLVLPRAPGSVLDRHIITPLEQLRLADGHVEGGEPSTSSLAVPRSPRRSMSVPTGLKTAEDAEDDYASLPSSRRMTCSGEPPSTSSSRPCSTSASGSGSARASYQSPGAVLGQSRMADGTVALSPPPRPVRNSTRRGSGSVAGSPPHSMVVKQADGSVGIGLGNARQMDRTPSSQSDMTARFESPERRRSNGREWDRDQETSPRTRALLTFRELDAPRRPPLSEREKADIWNDLLERSDKAGGTLHLKSTAELMSDSMRLSTHSEI